MKKAIVTGATSFIGAHLIKKLVEEGWKVYAVVRKKIQRKNYYLTANKS